MEFLNIFFEFLHISIIVLNIFGWILKKTRKANLVLLFFTAISWFGIGWFYGFGYCLITDWHWQIKRDLGQTNLPYSYIKLLIDRIFSIDFSPAKTDIITSVAFMIAFSMSIILNARDFYLYRKKKKQTA